MSLDTQLEMVFQVFQSSIIQVELCASTVSKVRTQDLHEKIIFLESLIHELGSKLDRKKTKHQKRWTRNLAIIMILNIWDELLTFFGLFIYVLWIK